MTVTNYAASVDNYMLTSVRYLMFTNGVADIKSTLADAKGSSFCLYPNPVVDVLNIQLSAMESQTATLELLSIDGKLLYKAQFNNTGSYQVNVSHLRQGIYLCRLNDGTSIETKKIVKQ